MANSVIDIVNMALGELGVNRISALNEPGSLAAEKATLYYPYARDEVLEEDDWNFAVTRVSLAKLVTEPVDMYDYAYSLPPDFIRVCHDRYEYPYNDYAVHTGGQQIEYSIEIISDGSKCLLTNYDSAGGEIFLKYVRREENVARYPPAVTRALVYRLASLMAIPLTESDKKYQFTTALYNEWLQKAMNKNALSYVIKDEMGNSDWLDAGR